MKKEKYTTILKVIVSIMSVLSILFILYDSLISDFIVIIILTVSTVILTVLIIVNNKYVLYVLTILVFFQNFICLLLANFISITIFNILIAIKEIILMLSVLSLVIFLKRYQKNISKSIMFSFIAILVLACSYFTSNAPAMAKITSLRQLVLPFLLYIFACNLIITENQIIKYLRTVVILTCILCIFGFIEMAIGDWLWIKLGIYKFVLNKGQISYLNGDGLPQGFYTFDLIRVFGKAIRRMASFIVDPVALGQIIVFSLNVILFYKKLFKNNLIRVFIIIILSIGLLMTFGKGGILIFGICYCYCLEKYYNKKYLSRIISVGLIIFGVYFIVYSNNNSLSAGNHFNGLFQNLIDLKSNIFGKGLGNAGNFAFLYNDSEDIGAGESFVGTLIGQLGVIGVTIYCLFYYYIFKELNYLLKNTSYRKLVIPIIGNLMGLVIVSFLSGTAISYIPVFLYFILIGLIKKFNNTNTL